MDTGDYSQGGWKFFTADPANYPYGDGHGHDGDGVGCGRHGHWNGDGESRAALHANGTEQTIRTDPAPDDLRQLVTNTVAFSHLWR